MKTSLLFSLIFVASSAFAKDYKLTDPAILGEYKLENANRKSEIKKAELVYNEDQVLVVRVDRNDEEYELSGPDKNGVVFEGEDECNAGSGDEPNCYYDAETIIKLDSVTVRGETIPQLTIQITVMDGYDEDYQKTTKYVLNWSRELNHAIPYYTNTKNPRALHQIIETCNRELNDLEYDDVTRYTNTNDICPFARSVKYRDLNKALAALQKTDLGEDMKEVTESEAKQLFQQAKNLAKKYKGKGGSSVTPKKIVEQINKVEEYVLAADQIYYYPFFDSAEFVIVNKDKKIITRFGIQIKK